MNSTVERRLAGRVTMLLLAAVALIGLAHVAFLPPWEGFDETAHWSYIQQIADTGRAPRYGMDKISRDIDVWAGPMPYSGAPPFDKNGHLTFRGYREAGAKPLPGGPARYAPGRDDNWQAQHPPLYYALLSPLYEAARGFGWVDHLLILRSASFGMAFIGFAIGILGTTRPWTLESARFGLWTGPIMAGWPFLFPQFFPEFARLGNDSLCLLFAGIAWALTVRLLEGEGRWMSALGLGMALGLGLLVKAFFLPIGVGIGGALLLGWWTGGRRMEPLAQAMLVGVVALLIGGWWYVSKQIQTGSITGADEFIRLQKAGGAGKLAEGFSPTELLRGLAVILTTFVWAGSWSLARLPEVLLFPPLALLGLTLFDYAKTLRRDDSVGWAPLLLAMPMAAGLIYHVFVWMAGTSAVTPGWYFHILAAPLGLAVAKGWARPRVLAVLTAYTALYTAASWAFQFSMFSGCAAKIGENEHYDLTGSRCFIDMHALGGLTSPFLGAASLVLGVVLAVTAATLALRAFVPPPPAELAEIAF